MKKCTKCSKTRNLIEFYKHGPSKDGYRNHCIECCLEYRNSKGKAKQLKQRYGISIDEYNVIFEEQNGCCAICKIHQSELKISLSVDHSHETGENRGLLCGKCNRGIGFLNDSIENLEGAISYLKRFLKQHTGS